jgi:Carbamoyltransferase C-terminus
MSCFARVNVNGRRRLPTPPERIKPFNRPLTSQSPEAPDRPAPYGRNVRWGGWYPGIMGSRFGRTPIAYRLQQRIRGNYGTWPGPSPPYSRMPHSRPLRASSKGGSLRVRPNGFPHPERIGDRAASLHSIVSWRVGARREFLYSSGGRCPAVVHVDGTARPRIINHQVNPSYYGIVDHYHRMTGLPAIINTSFNMHEEPIVMSPDDAIRSFLASGLDVLAVGPYLCNRKR